MVETLTGLIATGRGPSYPSNWPQTTADADLWNAAIDGLVDARWAMLGLWAEPDEVHLALLEAGEPAILSFNCVNGSFPSVGARHPPAIRPERAIRDLFGLEPVGLEDRRPWLDHGRWGTSHPMSRKAGPPDPQSYVFLPVEGEFLHQVPVGPVHAGIIEPGHFRFTASGETVVRLEERLGYTHKGIASLMAGSDLDRAARIAGRVSGDSTVAYQLAFCRAAEAAHGAEVPARAQWLRALMAELERLANHLGDIGAICNDASFAVMHAHTGILREEVLRAADTAFGHRLMRDRIVPGGVAADFGAAGATAIRALVASIRRRFPGLVRLYENSASLLDRTVGTGIVKVELCRQFAAGGFVGRACGRAFDTRKSPGYPPYGELDFGIVTRQTGDVDGRVWVRIGEVEQSLALIEQILGELPEGPIGAPLGSLDGAREGMALVEGFRGDILAWLRLDGSGAVEASYLRDPSWFQWPLLEAAIEGNIVADFPLCNKSFNCSYSGHDL